MKLPNFLDNITMNALRQGMGIPPDQYGSFEISVDPGKLTPLELEKLTSGEGIDIEFEKLTILPDGTLAYKDSRVLLYIRDHHAHQGEITPPKYHFYNCRTLGMMRRNRRFDRYVVATEITGFFRINILENGSKKGDRHKLGVCQNCLDEISFEGFSLSLPKTQRMTYVEKFLPATFFEKYPRSLILSKPKHSADTAPTNDYPDNWGEISKAVRARANWTCQRCGLVLHIHRKKYLHVHHINGVRSDNGMNNLEALCLGCHSDEPAHSRMKRSPMYLEFIRETGWKSKRRR